MESKRDLDRPEIMEDMSEEVEDTIRGGRSRRRRLEYGMDPQKKSIIIGAAGAVLLIIILIVFLSGGDKNITKELDASKSRMEGLEKRFARVEGAEQKISSLESQVKGLQASVTRVEAQARAMREQLEKMAQQPPPPPKPQPQATAPQKKPAQAEKRLHEVRRGETLFSIAKKYGMTPDELRRVNHLSKSDSLQPGQKLIVGSGT